MASSAEFAELLRQHRSAARLSYGALADLTHYDRAHIHHIEHGRRAATADFAIAADEALSAAGALVAAFEREETDRRTQAANRKTLAAALAASRDLAALADLELDDLHSGVEETAIDYLASPPGPMLHRAHALRGDVFSRLRDHRHGPGQRTDLLIVAGRLSGILAYAALDLGAPDSALEHAQAAASCAQLAGDTELLLWSRGTQSLISRFQGDYAAAIDFVEDGLARAQPGVPGTGVARLLSGRAQSLANLGDSRGANFALDEAERVHESVDRPDSVPGLFAFSDTKRRYYAGSSLIWPGGPGDAQRAEREALSAIASWQRMSVAERSLDDERLAHIYVATARVQQNNVEGAAAAMAPILTLPAEEQISWIVKRASRVEALLAAPRFRGSSAAVDLRQAIAAIRGGMQSQESP
ncbi:helix-turn-helix transcriptional regulator [Streptomyces sp. MP131-18]|uniref:helix-turn-helix domain-containing protein n=1 Tax=Streptomyces sp. MP131-18 TaxID=1857892 RepID=UPI00097CB757|nr:helix-turn-helix transcriptional regulator [Streptomyces sp. MP131-18]ONK09260.1 ATP-dependent transcriptional regulator [Streptomyces sp. MP131-18]